MGPKCNKGFLVASVLQNAHTLRTFDFHLNIEEKLKSSIFYDLNDVAMLVADAFIDVIFVLDVNVVLAVAVSGN